MRYWSSNDLTFFSRILSFYLILMRLEKSDFFSQWTRGNMKIRLEKPVMNISNLTGGKNEKARPGPLHEKLRLNCILVRFTRSFYCFIIHIQTSFFSDYDVTTLKIIHPVTFRIMQSNKSKCCEIKITSCNLFV